MTLSLLIGFDGSATAAAAVRAAGALFPGARALVATVRHDPPALAESAALARIGAPDDVILGGLATLERAAADETRATALEGERTAIASGLVPERLVELEPGAPWRALARLARERGVDVVVCGSRGQGAFSRATLGSTSCALLHHIERPVLIVPGGGGSLTGPAVIGYDGSEEAAAAIERAARLLPGRRTLVVHVWESVLLHSVGGRALGSLPVEGVRGMTKALEETYRSGALALARQGAELARARGLDATALEQEAKGAAWHGLLAAGHAANGSPLVVGSRGRGAASSTLLGSVSAGLVHNADRPILVIPGGGHVNVEPKEEP